MYVCEIERESVCVFKWERERKRITKGTVKTIFKGRFALRRQFLFSPIFKESGKKLHNALCTPYILLFCLCVAAIICDDHTSSMVPHHHVFTDFSPTCLFSIRFLVGRNRFRIIILSSRFSLGLRKRTQGRKSWLTYTSCLVLQYLRKE